MFELIPIASHVLSIKQEEVISKLDMELAPDEESRLLKYIAERKQGRPLAYITHKKEFYSEEFFVDERVLIPRPETEHVVEEALTVLEGSKTQPLILDMGCGSGVIGIVLSKITGCKVVCVDKSYDATFVTKMNTSLHHLNGNVSIVCSNLFYGIKKRRIFDLVLANMPYISSSEWDVLPIDVKMFEPEMALKGGEDGLAVYRNLISSLPFYLKENGIFICEIGSKLQAVSIGEQLQKLGFDYTVKKDLSGRERVVIGKWKSLL